MHNSSLNEWYRDIYLASKVILRFQRKWVHHAHKVCSFCEQKIFHYRSSTSPSNGGNVSALPNIPSSSRTLLNPTDANATEHDLD